MRRHSRAAAMYRHALHGRFCMEHLMRMLVERFNSMKAQWGDQRVEQIFSGERLAAKEGDLPESVRKEAVEAYDQAWKQVFPGKPLPKE